MSLWQNFPKVKLWQVSNNINSPNGQKWQKVWRNCFATPFATCFYDTTTFQRCFKPFLGISTVLCKCTSFYRRVSFQLTFALTYLSPLCSFICVCALMCVIRCFCNVLMHDATITHKLSRSPGESAFAHARLSSPQRHLQRGLAKPHGTVA